MHGYVKRSYMKYSSDALIRLTISCLSKNASYWLTPVDPKPTEKTPIIYQNTFIYIHLYIYIYDLFKQNYFDIWCISHPVNKIKNTNNNNDNALKKLKKYDYQKHITLLIT